VLEEAPFEEVPGEPGDNEEDIGEGAYDGSMGELNCAGNPWCEGGAH
jgi:hypothetical protein